MEINETTTITVPLPQISAITQSQTLSQPCKQQARELHPLSSIRSRGIVSYPIGHRYELATGCVCGVCGEEVDFLLKCALADWRCQECSRKLAEASGHGKIKNKSGDPSMGAPQGCTALTMYAEARDDSCFLEEVRIGYI